MRAVLTTTIHNPRGIAVAAAGTPVTVWTVAENDDPTRVVRTLVVTDDGVALRVGPYDWEVV